MENQSLDLGEIILIVEDYLKPIVLRSIDVEVAFFLDKREQLDFMKKKIKEIPQTISGVENREWRDIYNFLYSHWDKELKKQVDGAIYSDIPKSKHNYLTMSEKDMREKINKRYMKDLEKTLDSISKLIQKEEPSEIEMGCSDHDFNFILTINGKRRSLTINTIVAEGFVQTRHLRTLIKLHKGIV